MVDPIHRDHGSVEEAAEAAMRSFEEEQRKLVDLQHKMDTDSSTVRAKDRSLSMTFDGRGELTAVKFIGTKFRSMAPAELAHVIVDTVRVGRAQCMEKLAEGMSDMTLPGVDFAELATGKADPEKFLNALLAPIMGEMADGVLGRPSKDNRSSKDIEG